MPGTETDVIAALVGTFAVYVLGCCVWPWRRCPRCDGGKLFSPFRGGFRSCPDCAGKGKLRRFWSWPRGRDVP